MTRSKGHCLMSSWYQLEESYSLVLQVRVKHTLKRDVTLQYDFLKERTNNKLDMVVKN